MCPILSLFKASPDWGLYLTQSERIRDLKYIHKMPCAISGQHDLGCDALAYSEFPHYPPGEGIIQDVHITG